MKRMLPVIFCCVTFSACDQPSFDELPAAYTSVLSDLGYLSVYPPREDFHVGDVYFRSYSLSDPHNPATTRRMLVYSFASLREVAERNARERYAFSNTEFGDSGPSIDSPDFGARNGPLDTLPRVAFPAIVGVTAGTFGTNDPSLMGLGVSLYGGTLVEMSFSNVRQMDAGTGRPEVFSLMVGEVQSAICHNSQLVRQNARLRGFDCESPGRTCDYIVVTSTYVTNVLNFRYVESITGAAAQTAAPESEAVPTSSGPVINITLPAASTTMTEVTTTLGEEIKKTGQLPSTNANGTIIAGTQGTGLIFSQQFPRPVAIAFEGYPFDDLRSCALNN